MEKVTLSNHGEILHQDFDFDAGGQHWRGESGASAHCVRVFPAQGCFLSNSGQRVLQKQFPTVLAWAMTIHKSQGATEKDGAVVTLHDTVRQPCQAYVSLSRVKR